VPPLPTARRTEVSSASRAISGATTASAVRKNLLSRWAAVSATSMGSADAGGAAAASFPARIR
jgi:hypothetical protein